MSSKKIEALSNGVFLIALGVLFYTNFWWPGILIALWLALATRQLLSSRKFDFIVSSLILGGIFVLSYFRISWDVVLPAFFVLGGLYIVGREYVYSESETK